ncbi:MAG: trehalose-6-phosphate synthase [Candidatus Daviesbacteria bacterium]|nr:trehalose-6-phosphate synthase [Candidatus Daviesbacteria bacterium]
MKQVIAALLVIITIITLFVVAFTVNQVGEEEQRLKSDLQYRSMLLTESLKATVEPNLTSESANYLQSAVEKFANKERVTGLVIYDNKSKVMAVSSTILEATSAASEIVTNAMDADKANGNFETLENKKVYILAVPMHDDKSVVGALMVIQNAGYIDDRLNEIWKNNLIRLVVQASLLSFATLLLIRWIIYKPIRGLVETLKLARMGGSEQLPKGLTSSFFFRPLVEEISNMRSSLMEARISASEEARLRLEKLDSPWTAERLKEFIKDILKGRTIFMVSNREPYIHTKTGRKIDYYFPASGVVTAIEPVMQACGGVWIAHGSGDADRLVVDSNSKIKVPPDEPKYVLRRIWLTEQEEVGYYYGFSNEALWPLCHIAYQRPIFKKEDWEEYKKVNQKFADVILSEIKNHDRPIVLIQDFHLALVPKMVKMQRPGAVVGIFWHIPWSSPESFSICPWKKEILDGMLGADLIGFQTQLHCNNFIETAGRELESLIDFERFAITRSNHTSYVKPFPISIAFPDGFDKTKDLDGKEEKERLLKSLRIKTKYIGLGIDRLDYTKGILERFKAIEIFLNRYPPYKGKFTFVQIAAPSRTRIKKYRDFAIEVENEADRINALFKAKTWKPIILLAKHHSHSEIQKFYRATDFCLVTSLHDGMNLVAKEYVASRYDEKGVLILSQYTGASRELKDALIVNPYNGEQTADAIKKALEMTAKEQTKRMRSMREIIKNYNVYRWSAELLKTIVNLG